MSLRQLKITKSITNRESQSLEKYLQEIGKVELITPQEEVKLAILIKQGCQKSLDRLVKANLRFVVSVAKQYQHQGLSLPDLINEGNLGLIKAAQRFDETRGFKFISYAVWWIRQSILQALAEQSRIVRLPLNKVGLTNRIQKVRSDLEQKLEREPSAEELAEVLEMNIEEVSATIGINGRHLSFDSPIAEGEDANLYDITEDTEVQRTDKEMDHHYSLKKDIERCLDKLKPREKEVVCFLFGIGIERPLSVEEIAEKYAYSDGWVRAIQEKAFRRLRNNERKYPLLRNYLSG
jgi:RNA polymerase primary sigma factor